MIECQECRYFDKCGRCDNQNGCSNKEFIKYLYNLAYNNALDDVEKQIDIEINKCGWCNTDEIIKNLRR